MLGERSDGLSLGNIAGEGLALDAEALEFLKRTIEAVDDDVNDHDVVAHCAHDLGGLEAHAAAAAGDNANFLHSPLSFLIVYSLAQPSSRTWYPSLF